jgi:hypothetical protein
VILLTLKSRLQRIADLRKRITHARHDQKEIPEGESRQGEIRARQEFGEEAHASQAQGEVAAPDVR